MKNRNKKNIVTSPGKLNRKAKWKLKNSEKGNSLPQKQRNKK